MQFVSTKALCEYLVSTGMSEPEIVSVVKTLVDMTAEEVRCTVKMPFGKYKGLAVQEIALNDVDYLVWLASKLDRNDERNIELVPAVEAAIKAVKH